MKFIYVLFMFGMLIDVRADEVEGSGTANKTDPENRSPLGGSSKTGCYSGYCLNGGKCFGSLSCVCASGFIGSRCEQTSGGNPCYPNPCRGGTRCQASGSTYQCVAIIRRHCVPNPCPRGTLCAITSLPPYHTCTPTNPCFPNPCVAGTTCRLMGNSHTCVSTDPCARNPCPVGTLCTPIGTGHTCTQVNPCSPNPCQVGTQCVALGTSYRCDGPQSNPCAPSRCRNGCVCTPSCRHAEGYYCKSQNGYLGKNCNIAPPTVRCERTRMIVNVDEAVLREYGISGNTILVMGQNSLGRSNECTLTKFGTSYTISLPFGVGAQCGVRESKSVEGLQYDDTLWIRLNGAANYDVPIPLMKIVCKYIPEYTVTTSFQPQVDTPRMISSQGVIAKGSIDLCKVGTSCPNTCPANFRVTGGGIYTVGEVIHLNIRTGTNDPQQKAVLERLYLSCDSTINALAVVDLVNMGCVTSFPTNQLYTKLTHNAQSDCVCVSFQVPKLTNCGQVYIHAKLRDCTGKSLQNCPSSTVKTCAQTSGQVYGGKRRKRNLNETSVVDSVFGPLYFFSVGKTESETVIFPGKELVPVDAVLPKQSPGSLVPVDAVLPKQSPSSDRAPTLQLYVALAAVFLLLSSVFCLIYFLVRKKF